MNINTKMRLTMLASAFALAAVAPAAFADSAFAQGAGTWYQDIHTDPATGAGDFPGEVHSRQVMEQKIVRSNVAANTGTWYQDIHTDPATGAGDFSGEVHSRQVMEMKIVPSNFAGTQVESIIYPYSAVGN